MKLKRLSLRNWGPLLGGLLLILSSILYLEFARRNHRDSTIVFDKSGPAPKSTENSEQGKSPKGRATSAAKQTSRTLLIGLLDKHRGDAFLLERGVGIPFDLSNSKNQAWRDFWTFISEVKAQLGSDAFSTLRSFMNDAESTAYKDLFAAAIVALKDPQAEPYLTSLIKDQKAPLSHRSLAIYGLGQIGTESAWASFQQLWPELNKADYDRNLLKEIRRAGFLAMGSFGKPGAAMVIKEVESLIKDGNPTLAGHFMSYARGADPLQLERLLKESTSAAVKDGALRAMSTDLSTPATMSTMVEILLKNPNPETRQMTAFHLANALRLGNASLENSPEALERLIVTFNTLPPDLQLALYRDPAAKALLPMSIEQFAATSGIASSPSQITSLAAIYAADPSTHGLLSQFLLAHWKEGALSGIYTGFVALGKDYSDPELAATLAKMAVDPAYKDARTDIMMILGKGPAEPRQDALRQAAVSYWAQSREDERFAMVGQISAAGADAKPVLMNLIKQESAPMPRLEMACELLSSALGSEGDLAVIEPVVKQSLDQILKGDSDLGIQYIALHPQGFMTGLTRFSDLIKNYYSAYGTSAQIPQIRTFADRLFIPEHMMGNDVRSANFIRNQLREALLQSIDEIRRREQSE
jgi:hypothetical protein